MLNLSNVTAKGSCGFSRFFSERRQTGRLLMSHFWSFARFLVFWKEPQRDETTSCILPTNFN